LMGIPVLEPADNFVVSENADVHAILPGDVGAKASDNGGIASKEERQDVCVNQGWLHDCASGKTLTCVVRQRPV